MTKIGPRRSDDRGDRRYVHYRLIDMGSRRITLLGIPQGTYDPKDLYLSFRRRSDGSWKWRRLQTYMTGWGPGDNFKKEYVFLPGRQPAPVWLAALVAAEEARDD